MYGSKATFLYNQLVAKGVVGAEGTIRLDLLGTNVIINDKSATGNLLQEWLGQWMTLNGIYSRVDTNTQKFPDYYLSESDELDLLEVKTFDYVKSPNFDVAQFDAYVRDLRTKAYKLDADYIILGYSLSNGVIKINDIWIKKIWEITCGSTQYPLRTQIKQDKIYNIRPYNFKTVSQGHQPFNSRLEFIKAIKGTLELYVNPDYAQQWFDDVAASYSEFAKAQL